MIKILRLVDPLAGGQRLEQRPVAAARRAAIDVFDNSPVAQAGITQTRRQSPVIAFGDFPIVQQAKPFGV